MELIWSNDGVSTLFLRTKILLFPEEKENKSTKFVKVLKNVFVLLVSAIKENPCGGYFRRKIVEANNSFHWYYLDCLFYGGHQYNFDIKLPKCSRDYWGR